MNSLRKFNINISGKGTQPMMFAHGYGCDQNMWRFMAPSFEEDFKVVLFDHIGAGNSDTSFYNKEKYASLNGYADDVLEICEDLGLREVIYVGHSVSAMIGVLAAIKSPSVFSRLILVAPSPCYINHEGYVGGFSREDIDELLAALEGNYLGWSTNMAPVIMGNPERPALGEELTNSFCRTDPDIAKNFAKATFLSDNRKDLSKLTVPALILQCSDDLIAPNEVGRYLQANISQSALMEMKAKGHCPNLSAPDETVDCIKRYLRTQGFYG